MGGMRSSTRSAPNILLFFTDDHAAWAARCFGTADILSPTMDYLAETGAHLPFAFTPCAVCSPARASLYTGKFPSGHGIHDHLNDEVTTGKHPALRGQRILPEFLKERGYATGLSGKWHLQEFTKPFRGFDYWFSQATGTNARFGPQPFYFGDQRMMFQGHQAPVITDYALRYLREERPKEAPFFLAVGYTDTHSPHSGSPERLVEYYRKNATWADVPRENFAPVHGRPSHGTGEMSDAEYREMMAEYSAAVTMIDEQIGRLMDELDSRGELDDTLIIMVGDHGHNNMRHGIMSKGNATIPQNFLEETMRVPLLMRLPGDILPGQRWHAMVDHCDLHQTIRDYAGVGEVDDSEETLRPGRSFRGLLRGDPSYEPKTYQFGEYGNARMVRSECLKLIRRYPGPNGRFSDQLFDLRSDPRETMNLLDEPRYEEEVRKMDQALEEFFARCTHPERDGLKVDQLPRCNKQEPWRAGVG